MKWLNYWEKMQLQIDKYAYPVKLNDSTQQENFPFSAILKFIVLFVDILWAIGDCFWNLCFSSWFGSSNFEKL